MGSGLNRFEVIRDERPNDTAWPGMTWPPTVARLPGHVVELSPCVPEHDAGPLFHALNHDAVWRHVPGRPKSPEQFTVALAKRQAEGRFVWIVRLLRPYAGIATGSIVGTSSYLEVAPTDARLEIGATLYVPGVWGTKVNPDAKLLLLAHAFETLGAGRVQLKTDVRNERSQLAIARLGARYEGTLRRFQRRDDGTVRDSVLFSIVADDWPEVRERLIVRLKEAGHG
jgi:RimJ/RimL family protein N-acetyltransferase